MDCFGRRAQVMQALDKAIERAQKSQRDAESGQHGLFGVFADEQVEHANDALPNTPDWDEQVRLAAEKEVLGFFITGHPLEKYKDKLADLNALSIEEVGAMKKSTAKDENITTAGLISGIRVAKAKRSGELWAQASLEDIRGRSSCSFFRRPTESSRRRSSSKFPCWYAEGFALKRARMRNSLLMTLLRWMTARALAQGAAH